MLIDTHAHISDGRFDADRAEVLARAREAGIERILDVGIDLGTSRRAVRLARREPLVRAVVGVQPHDADRVDGETMAALRELAQDPLVVGIGETGLDFYRDRASRAGQLAALRLHLGLAAELGLPIVLHLRSAATSGEASARAYEVCAEVLADYADAVTPIAHCFSGTVAAAERMVALGGYVSFAGNVTYPKATELREACRAVPLERLLVETDCPYLAPQGRRGQRNEPALVRLTAERIAKERGIAFGELAARASANARRAFVLADAAAGG